MLADLGEKEYQRQEFIFSTFMCFVPHTAIDTEQYRGQPKSCLLSRPKSDADTLGLEGEQRVHNR